MLWQRSLYLIRLVAMYYTNPEVIRAMLWQRSLYLIRLVALRSARGRRRVGNVSRGRRRSSLVSSPSGIIAWCVAAAIGTCGGGGRCAGGLCGSGGR